LRRDLGICVTETLGDEARTLSSRGGLPPAFVVVAKLAHLAGLPRSPVHSRKVVTVAWQRQPRPPQAGLCHRDHRIEEALDEIHVLERAHPQSRPAINKARHRVGRIRSAINKHSLRHQFDKAEKLYVDVIR
jgi:hypothetical protein